MLKRILIANRGEIALRIIRACKELGIETVAVYSEVDEDALHLRFADETVCIGPGPSRQSYLDIPRIIAAAEITDVDAIHPGYGFLSENPRFAQVCRDCKIGFIGPSPEAMLAVGDKARARALAVSAGVPVVPGSEGVLKDVDEAFEIAERLGYPLMIKAVAGGGGRGMRLARDAEQLRSGFAQASAEALAAFKNGDVYIERYVENPRHVEIQIFADSQGNFVHLGERDCSVQRRHQKLIEESPSPVLEARTRVAMGEAAIALARAAVYENAGTVEFLLDPQGRFYFMEMNARIQVEHPVTELVTGTDLVQTQILVAGGEPLPFTQSQLQPRGHAIECRVNAEDPAHGFRPSPGKVATWVPPGGHSVRVDSHLYSGYRIPPDYDSLIAKFVVHRPTRAEAIATMLRALDETVVEGVRTTIPLHKKILTDAEFTSGAVDTSWLDRNLLRLMGSDRKG
ncbi:MAG: acetyl-CoA carboxylase biotin carboxylase subunit [Planctomycetes bacterium]|nr:acetyl-CoA carboxylase biotin carboxylase subunit [Planctomycetota bacterium]